MEAKTILITGPSGAGKSTTSKALLEHLDGEWAYINQDDIRSMVKVGYKGADGVEWSVETKNQVAVSVPICTDLVKRYREYGINCIVDFFCSPDEFYEWAEMLGDIKYELFVLLPSESETLRRNTNRSTGALSDEKAQINHKVMTTWLDKDVKVINTTGKSVGYSIDEIIKTIDALG